VTGPKGRRVENVPRSILPPRVPRGGTS